MTDESNQATGPPSRPTASGTSRSLQTDQDFFRLLMQSITDYCMLVLDADGRVVSCNAGAEQMLGYSEAEMVGQHFSFLFTREDIENQLPGRELETAYDQGRSENDHWHVRKDGSRFWGSGVTTPLRGDTLWGYASVIRDLTDQKLAQDRLQESEERHRRLAAELEEMSRRRDHFLAVLSHEIRNPLAPILSALQLMQQHTSSCALQQQARGVIERQVQQLANLVNDLLDISRVTAGKLQLRTEQVELCDIVQRAIESARPDIDRRGHSLWISLSEEPVWLQADPCRLEQIFLNLLNNAAKYTPPGGQIRVSVGQQGGEAIVSVCDDGVGIPAELQLGIFEMFTQVDPDLHVSNDGLGIGLTLVKNLVELHQGQISVHSEGPNRGSEFSVRLPALAFECEQPQFSETVVQHAPRGLRVLVADDNRDAATMLSLILKNLGTLVQVAYDGREALQVAAGFAPNLVLLDIGMPELDGYETARQMRRQPWAQAALLVALTGWGQEDDKRRSREAGFDEHLTKPVGLDELQTLLARVGQRASAATRPSAEAG